MLGFGGRIGEGVLQDVASAIVVALLVYGFAKVFWRRRIRRFFGIVPARGVVGVFLSCIDVAPGGSVGTEPTIAGSRGTAINHLEYRAALRLAGAIQARPLVRALHAFRPTDWELAEPITCRIQVSPSGAEYQERMAAGQTALIAADVRRLAGNGAVVLAGSFVYNVMTKVIVQDSTARTTFLVEREDDQGRPLPLPRRGLAIRDESGHPVRRYFRTDPPATPGSATPGYLAAPTLYEYFAVESFIWDGRHVFLCAGTCTAGTVAAIRQLAAWQSLHRDFGDKPFVAIYELALTSVEARESEPAAGGWQRVYRDPPD